MCVGSQLRTHHPPSSETNISSARWLNLWCSALSAPCCFFSITRVYWSRVKEHAPSRRTRGPMSHSTLSWAAMPWAPDTMSQEPPIRRVHHIRAPRRLPRPHASAAEATSPPTPSDGRLVALESPLLPICTCLPIPHPTSSKGVNARYFERVWLAEQTHNHSPEYGMALSNGLGTGSVQCSCSSRRTLQSYRHKVQSWHPPTRRRRCHPRGLLIHCYSNHVHGCVVSASRRASSHADWRLLTRRHHLQCHPRGYAEIRMSRYRLAAPANGSQSRPALGLRVWVATSTG